MARKNRSNNTFAPIVITVLVAGVVGYYAFVKAPPQSILAEGDAQDGLPFSGSPSEENFQLDRGLDTLAGDSSDTASKLGGISEISGPLSSKSALTAPGGKLGETKSTLLGPQIGLVPDPIPDGAPGIPDADTGKSITPASSPQSVDSDPTNIVGAKPSNTPEPTPIPTGAPPAEPKPVVATKLYMVQDGDRIITIARDWFGESGRHDEIIALNPGVDPTRLQIGQMLKMPSKSQPRTKPIDPTLSADEYRISPNDNFTKIARLLLGDEARASEIAALNPDLDPGNLQVGTVIKVPPKQIKKLESRPVKRPPLRTGEKYYTVKSGDSLARIVGDFWGVQREDWVDLLYLRNKDTIGEDRAKLNLDQVLIIPAKPKS